MNISIENPTGSHFVYKLYDITLALLYVGSSKQYISRIKSHIQKPWGWDIEYVDVIGYETKKDALIAEIIAIISQRPMYNKNGLSTDLIYEMILDRSLTKAQTIALLDSKYLNMPKGFEKMRAAILYDDRRTAMQISRAPVWQLIGAKKK